MIVEFKSPVTTVFVNLLGFIIMSAAPIVVALLAGVKGDGQWSLVLLITFAVILMRARAIVKHARKKNELEKEAR